MSARWWSALLFQAGGGKRVAAVAVRQVTRDATDRRDADTRLLVNLAIGDALLQQGNDGPAIRQRLQLGGRAQVAKERPALLDAAQGEDGAEQRPFRQHLLAGGKCPMLFHNAVLVIMY